ncbi:MAG: hypothetical protein ACXVVU_20270, partial [Solirubrobacteraceae bacterium]
IGRRDQANAWIWRLAEYTREVHEEYAVQRWPETKRLLGLLVNSSGGAHARNARRLVHAARKQDRRLQAALLAAAVAHTPEAEEVLRGARTRLARKPSALSRELLRNFPKGKGRRSRRRRKKAAAAAGGRPGAGAVQTRAGPDEEALDDAVATTTADGADASSNGAGQIGEQATAGDSGAGDKPVSRSRSRRSRRRKDADPARDAPDADQQPTPAVATASESAGDEQTEASADGAGKPARKRRPRRAAATASEGSAASEVADATSDAPAADASADGKPAEKPKPRRTRKAPAGKKADKDADGSPAESPADSSAEAA